ncbi:MAG: class D sortase [Anaerolineales bacterium]|nr:class D sortase [Anaerolineales bacterium]
MSKPKRTEDLSEQELRRLLLEKRRLIRQERLERFRRTGRALTLSPDLPNEADETWHPAPRVKVETPVTPEGAEISENVHQTMHQRRRRMMDRILVGVEILALVGLLGVLANGFGLLQTLNQEVLSALQQETLTPTPLITAVVLPGGHTPPTSVGGAQFNEAEIPEHLRPLVQSLANVPVPTASPGQAVRIQIPAINVDAPVVQGDNWEALKKGVGQAFGTANPGENGNVVLSAHNDIFGEIFRDLDRLHPGDLVILYTMQRQYVYVVTETRIVEPTAVEVMSQTANPTITLISCYPYMVDRQRIVVFANLQNP